jgi:hypothetical protein
MSDVDDLDRLYRLLPAIHRMRDADEGYPLQALLRLIGREAQVLEDDLLALYDGWFIETCSDWVVPYIGDLVGYRGAPEAGDPSNLDVSDPRSRLRVLLPRRDVANTIRARRRKGTLALLEDIARDSAGWPARAVEFFTQLAWARNLNHQRPQPWATADIGATSQLDDLGSAFSTAARTVDVRRPNSTLTPGRFNIPSVGLFAWRLRAFTVSHCQANCLEDIGPHRFAFSALGNDSQLFNVPKPDPTTAISEPLELPVAITRHMLEERLAPDPSRKPLIQSIASEDLYGLDKSLALWVPDWPVRGAPQPVPRERIVPADLSGWKYQTPRDHIAVDPVLGRFAFPARQLPRGSVYVSYAYGFAAPIGGGEYERPVLQPSGAIVYRVGADRPGAQATIKEALQRWQRSDPRPQSAVIEIIDSEVYTEPLNIRLEGGESLQIRAAVNTRPIIRLLDYIVDRADPLKVSGGRGSSFTLDGLLIGGRGLVIEGPDADDPDACEDDLCEVVIRHCTLVPGWALDEECEPIRPAEPSISVVGSQAHLQIEHSIVGSIAVAANPVTTEPLRVDLSDSILDATGHDCDLPECAALTAPDAVVAHALGTFRCCTVFGRVHTHAIELAENSIFTGLVRVARRQLGCMRFCSVVPGSRTPPRYQCQPDLATDGLPADERELAALAVRPQFMSTRYGTHDYARLANEGPKEIREGADDQSEMGVYHDLYQPQRTALLRHRLTEFTPAGMDTGLTWSD